MAGRKPILTREAYADASLKFIDQYGYDALTMRSLGEALGVHATALYRHFRNKKELIEAVLMRMFEVENVGIPESGSPRERLLALMKSLRRAFSRHTNLALPNLTLHDEQATVEFVRASLSLLGEMGLEGRQLMIAYQMLETFSVGSNAYDWVDYPKSLENKRQGRRLVGHPAADQAARSLASMRKLNEETFEVAANALLDACESMGHKKILR